MIRPDKRIKVKDLIEQLSKADPESEIKVRPDGFFNQGSTFNVYSSQLCFKKNEVIILVD